MSERDGAAGRGWIIDVDGCLVRTVRTGGAGGVPIDGAAEFLDELERRGEPYIVCTNASELTPGEYAQNLRALGLPVRDEHFATAGSAMADYLAAHHGTGPVLAVGSPGLRRTLRERGLELVDPADWVQAAAVAVGAAPRYVSAEMSGAALAVEGGAPLYTAVADPWFHGGHAKSAAISAVVAAGIGWAGGVTPTVLGKPSAALGQTLADAMAVAPTDVVVVGDARAEVDLARAMGGRVCLVLSGATTAAQAAATAEADPCVRVFPTIAELHTDLVNDRAPSKSSR